jgi:hypothetical protein
MLGRSSTLLGARRRRFVGPLSHRQILRTRARHGIVLPDA